MRIIAVGGAGTIGKAVVAALSDRHEVVVAGRHSGTIHVDIRSPDSVQAMYQQAGTFDALISTAGDAYFGPFGTMSETELALGIESKLLGQIRLVLLGRSLIADEGSFTLVSGYVLDDRSPSRAASRSRTAASRASSAPPPSTSTAESGSTRSARAWPSCLLPLR